MPEFLSDLWLVYRSVFEFALVGSALGTGLVWIFNNFGPRLGFAWTAALPAELRAPRLPLVGVRLRF